MLQLSTDELPRPQARVSSVVSRQIGSRPGVKAGSLDGWTMTRQLIHKSYSQSHLPTARCVSGNEVENARISSQIFLSRVFPFPVHMYVLCVEVLSQLEYEFSIY